MQSTSVIEWEGCCQGDSRTETEGSRDGNVVLVSSKALAQQHEMVPM